MADSQETIFLQVDTATSESSLAALRKEIDLTKDSIASLKITMDAGGASANDASVEYEKQSSELRILTTDYTAQKRVLDGYNASVASSRDTTNLLNNSINTNRQLLSQLTATYNGIANPSAALTATIRSVSDALKQQEGAIGDTRRNVGNYADAFTQAFGSVKAFGVSVGDVTGTIGGLKNGLSAAGAATGGLGEAFAGFIAGGGLTAVIGGITALVNALGSYVPFTEAVERSTAGLSEGFKAFFNGQDFATAAENASNLTGQLQDIARAQAAFDLSLSGSRLAIENYLLASRDLTITSAERIANLKAAAAAEEDLNQKTIANDKQTLATKTAYLKNTLSITETYYDESGELSDQSRRLTDKEIEGVIAGQTAKDNALRQETVTTKGSQDLLTAIVSLREGLNAKIITNEQSKAQAFRRIDQEQAQDRTAQIKALDEDAKTQIANGSATAESLIDIDNKKNTLLLSNDKSSKEERASIDRAADQFAIQTRLDFANRELSAQIKANQIQAQTLTDNEAQLIAIENESAQKELNNTSLHGNESKNIIDQRDQNILKIELDAANKRIDLQLNTQKILADQITRAGGDATQILLQEENERTQQLLNSITLRAAKGKELTVEQLQQIENIVHQHNLNVQKINNDDYLKQLNDTIAAQKNLAEQIQSSGGDASDLLINSEIQTQKTINADLTKTLAEKEELIAASNGRIENLEKQHAAFENNLQNQQLNNELEALKNKAQKEAIIGQDNAATLDAIDAKQKQIAEKNAADQLSVVQKNLDDEVDAVKQAANDGFISNEEAQDKIQQLIADASQEEINIEEAKENKIDAIDNAALERKIQSAAKTVSAVADNVGQVLSQVSSLIQQNQQQTIDALDAAKTAADNAEAANLKTELQQFGLSQDAKNALTQQSANKTAAIDAEAAAKKNELLKKQFEANKAFQIVQAIVSTAAAVANGLATFPFIPLGIIAAAAAGVAGAIQIATISSAKFTPPSLAKGGGIDVIGDSHAGGGVPLHIGGRLAAEVEGGEKVFVLKKNASDKINMLSSFNESFGGNSWLNGPVRHAAGGGFVDVSDGGFVARAMSENALTADAITNAVKNGFLNMPSPQVSVVEINEAQADLQRSVNVSRL